MPDNKISQLTAATSVDNTLVFPAVFGGNTVQVSLNTILKSLGANGKIELGGITSEVITAGVITNTTFLSKTNGACTLAPFTTGIMKFISAVSSSVVTVTGGSGFSTITLDANESALLIYIDAWYIISTNGVLA